MIGNIDSVYQKKEVGIMKLLGVVTSNYQKYLDTPLDGFVFHLENYAVDYFKYFTIEDIKEYKSKTTKECFVVINKMIFNKDIPNLITSLKTLADLNVTGVFFYDMAILNIVKEHNINLNLIFNETHLVTNSDTINLYYNLGVKGAYLSNEITLDDILTIRKKTKSELFVMLLGNPVAAMSKRHLLTSYFLHNSKPKKDTITIKEPVTKGEFLVKETDLGTTFFYNKILNLSNVYLKLQNNGINYGIINEGNFTTDEYISLINNFKDFNKSAIDKIAGHNRGFLYRETIYKVKR